MSATRKVLLIAGAAMAVLGVAFAYGSGYVLERKAQAHVAENPELVDGAELADLMLVALWCKAAGLGVTVIGGAVLIVALILGVRERGQAPTPCP